MLDLAVHMVVKNDFFYIPMAIESVYPFVKGIYIQDQSSTDGTSREAMKIIIAKQQPRRIYRDVISLVDNKIFMEVVDTGHKDRFDPDYDEPYWRTQALKRTEEIFKPKWLLKLDADEIYTPYFFRKLEELIGDGRGASFPYECIRVSGERFISKDLIAGALQDDLCNFERSPDGVLFIDPHTQVWRAGKYYYTNNPSFEGSHFHPILTPDPHPQFWLPGICNIHLHRLFGPKSVNFWEEGGEKVNPAKPFPPRDCPVWYNGPVNKGCAIKVDYPWPQYVLDKWKSWSEVW